MMTAILSSEVAHTDAYSCGGEENNGRIIHVVQLRDEVRSFVGNTAHMLRRGKYEDEANYSQQASRKTTVERALFD